MWNVSRGVCVFLNWRLWQAATGCACSCLDVSSSVGVGMARGEHQPMTILNLWTLLFLIFGWGDSYKEDWIPQVKGFKLKKVKICEQRKTNMWSPTHVQVLGESKFKVLVRVLKKHCSIGISIGGWEKNLYIWGVKQKSGICWLSKVEWELGFVREEWKYGI